MNKHGKIEISDKVKLPISWENIFIFSAITAFVCGFFGIMLRARFLILAADFIVIGIFLLALALGTVSVIKLFSSKTK